MSCLKHGVQPRVLTLHSVGYTGSPVPHAAANAVSRTVPAARGMPGGLTPEQVHFGNADQVIAGRKSVLREAWAAHPERFVRGVPKPKPLPEAVFINPPIPSLTTQDIAL